MKCCLNIKPANNKEEKMLYPRTNRYRNVFDLSGLWNFRLDPSAKGEKVGWFKGLDTGKCIDIAVPASWNEQFTADDFAGIDIHNYVGSAWYEKRFFVPEEKGEGRRLWLRIGAANYRAKVWLNGSLLGEHEGGFLPFQFEITEIVKKEEENLLVMKVDNTHSADTIPPGLPEIAHNYPPTVFDFFPYGGIHRPVLLYSTAQDYIKDITVITEIKQTQGIVKYKVTVEGDSAGVVGIGIKDKPEEEKVKNGMVEGELTVKGAHLWSPEDPFLYDFRVQLLVKGKIIDEYRLPIGIRTIEVKGNKLLLNGNSIFLRGVGKHEDFPIIGKGINLPLVIKDFSLLKWLGCNTFRTVHYPYCEELMYLADKLGFLVMTEVPAVSLSYSHITSRMKEVHKQMLKEMVERDKNHPSVIIWCVANEPGIGGAPEEEVIKTADFYFREICEYARTLDSTRPITIATCRHYDAVILKHCDIASLNRYCGWYNLPGQLDLADQELEEEMEEFYKTLGKPILVSEYGAGAVAGMHANPPALFTEEYQAELIERQSKVIKSKPYIIGGLIWAFSDFKTPQTSRRVILNRKGLFTRDRQPKMAAHRVRAMWRDRGRNKK